ncbi:MAG: hypothetical protein AAB317_00410 [Nitrospirota bacterium]
MPRFEIEIGLRTITCDAAIELDRFSRNRDVDFTAVRKLVQWTQEPVPGEQQSSSMLSLLDSPAKAVVLWDAIGDSRYKKLDKIDDLIQEVRDITQVFSDLLEDPKSFRSSHPEHLQWMGSFCLALSKRIAVSQHMSQETEPDHPYRR